jgi:hypothetical protein
MRLKCVRVFLLVGFTACNVFANSWICGASGNWSETINWSKGSVPDGSEETIIGCTTDSSTVTLDTYESWAYIHSNRMRVAGPSTLNITPGGSLIGPGWLRVGERGTPGEAKIVQTGGLLKLKSGGKDPTRLTLGDSQNSPGDTSGTYQISGGTLTHYVGATTSSEGSIIAGDRGGDGTLRVIGTGGTIDMGRLYMGGNPSLPGDRHSTGTLWFDVESDGVSAVGISNVVNLKPYENSISQLIVNLTEVLDDPNAAIVLVHNAGTSAVNGVFDTINGYAPPGGVVEGTEVLIDDSYYKVTYLYDADTDDMDNDIAWIPLGQTVQDQVDLNDDGKIDIYDFAAFASYWMQTCTPPDYCGGADLNRNGYVDLEDLVYLMLYWQESLP